MRRTGGLSYSRNPNLEFDEIGSNRNLRNDRDNLMSLQDRSLTLARMAAVAVALILLPMTQLAVAREGGGPGPAGGGAGPQRPQALPVFANSDFTVIRKIASRIAQNWDTEYELVIPNSNSQLNKALVKFARTHPAQAAVYISRISKNDFPQALRRRIKLDINRQEENLEAYSRELSRELAKGNRANRQTVNGYLFVINRLSTSISRLGDLERVIE